jgi:hypothetical protein
MHESGTFVCFTPAGAGLLSGDSSGSHRNEIQTAASSTCVSLVSSPFNLMAFRRDACAPACAARIAAARGHAVTAMSRRSGLWDESNGLTSIGIRPRNCAPEPKWFMTTKSASAISGWRRSIRRWLIVKNRKQAVSARRNERWHGQISNTYNGSQQQISITI